MRRTREARLCALACAVITMTACGDSTTPGDGDARGFAYVLESVDGAPLPVEMRWANGLPVYQQPIVAADTLWFGGPIFSIERYDASGARIVGFAGLHFSDGYSVRLYSNFTGSVGFDDSVPPDPPDVAGAVRNGQLTSRNIQRFQHLWLKSLANPATLPVPGRVLVYRRLNSPAPREQLTGTFVLEAVDGGAVPDSVPRSATSSTNVAFVAETLSVSIDRGFRRRMVTDPETILAYPKPGIVTTTRDSIFLRDQPFGFGEWRYPATTRGVVRHDGIEVRGASPWPLAGRLLWYRRITSN